MSSLICSKAEKERRFRIRPVTVFNAETFPVQIAGEIAEIPNACGSQAVNYTLTISSGFRGYNAACVIVKPRQ